MDKDKELEKLMNELQAPPVRGNLANRIIMAASCIEQKQSIWQGINRIFEEFKLPAPAYSFASLLLVGFAVGFMSYGITDDTNIIGQLLYEEEMFL